MTSVFLILSLLLHGVICVDFCGDPAFDLDVDYNDCMEVGEIEIPLEYTLGASLNYTCISLLWRTRANLDYCPMQRCESDATWRPAQLSCTSSECYDGDSQTYAGRRTCTASGKICQSWDVQTPHPHSYTDAGSFPDDTIADASNYCRDPGGVDGVPWCYTVEPDTEKEACGIPDCTGVTIGQGMCNNDYCGDPDLTVYSDNSCVSVTATPAYQRYLGSVIPLNCASLLSGFTGTMGYCPVSRCQNDFYWSSANISCGTNECYTSGQSMQYQGRRTCTSDGWPCKRWDTQTVYTSAASFPDDTSAENFCRDPDGTNGQPWCYTTNTGVPTQTCAIPECSSISVDSGVCSGDPVTTPTPPQNSEFIHYQKTPTSHVGYEVQSTLPYVVSAINCARMCHHLPGCVLLSYDSNNVCILHKQNADNTAPMDCTSKRCYIINSLL